MPQDHPVITAPSDFVPPSKPRGWNTEDWWSVGLAAFVFLVTTTAVVANLPADVDRRLATWAEARQELDRIAESASATPAEVKAAEGAVKAAKKNVAANPLAPWLGKVNELNVTPANPA